MNHYEEGRACRQESVIAAAKISTYLGGKCAKTVTSSARMTWEAGFSQIHANTVPFARNLCGRGNKEPHEASRANQHATAVPQYRHSEGGPPWRDDRMNLICKRGAYIVERNDYPC